MLALSEMSWQDHKNYTVAEGAPVSELLKGMLGPRCDENRDAAHELELKIQAIHAADSAKSNMKVETWTFHGDGTTWVNATSIFKYIYTGSQLARTQRRHFENMNIPHKLVEVQGERGGAAKHVYLMDMNYLYLVAVRLHGWEFMAAASHINANKAVRGFASDLQDFHEQGQRSSAAQLMQQGASAVAVAAIEDAQQPCVANDQSQLMGMFGKFFDKIDSRDVQLCKFLDKLDARDVKQDTTNTFLHDSMGTLVVAMKENHDVVQQNFLIIQEKLVDTDAKIADVQASADAKIADVEASADAKIAENKEEIAENKAEADAKIAQNKEEADSKIAELQNVMDKVVKRLDLFGAGARAAADGRGAGGPVRTYQKYTAAARKTTLEWMLRHSSHPYPTPVELEKLRKETGIDTTKRMSALLVQIRTKDMEKDNTGVWRKRVIQPSTSKKGKVWTQKNIKDWI